MRQRFDGSMRNCGNPEPHAPHLRGDDYRTPRYGWLSLFCPGGSAPAGPGPAPAPATHRVISMVQGCPDWPSSLTWEPPDSAAVAAALEAALVRRDDSRARHRAKGGGECGCLGCEQPDLEAIRAEARRTEASLAPTG